MSTNNERIEKLILDASSDNIISFARYEANGKFVEKESEAWKAEKYKIYNLLGRKEETSVGFTLWVTFMEIEVRGEKLCNRAKVVIDFDNEGNMLNYTFTKELNKGSEYTFDTLRDIFPELYFHPTD